MRYVDILCDELDVVERLGCLSRHSSPNAQIVSSEFSVWIFKTFTWHSMFNSQSIFLTMNLTPRKLQWLLDKIGIRGWIGPHCHVKVEYVDAIRSFKPWLQAAPCNFSGGFKDDSSALHAFIMLRRQGLVYETNNLKI